MIINIISYYSMKLYINNKKHEEVDYIKENDSLNISRENEILVNKLNSDIKERTSEIDELKENKVYNIEVYKEFQLSHCGDGNVFKVIYGVDEFQKRFYVIGEKAGSSYVFEFYGENDKEN